MKPHAAQPPVLDTHDAVFALPFGRVGVCERAGRLSRIDFLPPNTPEKTRDSRLIQELEAALQQYCRRPGPLPVFALAPCGSAFQRRVWNAIATIPSGETRRYGELATELGSSARAVGQACGDNPYPLLIPCHRIVGAQHRGGFAHQNEGWLTAIKAWLLAHEAKTGPLI